jgi:hypothetical protein
MNTEYTTLCHENPRGADRDRNERKNKRTTNATNFFGLYIENGQTAVELTSSLARSFGFDEMPSGPHLSVAAHVCPTFT